MATLKKHPVCSRNVFVVAIGTKGVQNHNIRYGVDIATGLNKIPLKKTSNVNR